MRIGAMFGAATFVICFATIPAMAASSTFKIPLSGKSEVPPTTSAGTGTLDLTYDPATRKLEWRGDYSGLTGPVTAAHFHGPAAPDGNAGVTLPVEAKTSPFAGFSTISQNQEADLLAGKWYFNLHTEQNKAGEIRGQVAPGK